MASLVNGCVETVTLCHRQLLALDSHHETVASIFKGREVSEWLATITGEALPTYFIFEKSSPAWALNLYMVVLFVLICQTGVGVLQGLIERLDAWQVSKKGKPLSRTGHGMTAGFMMVASLSLGSMGVVALILRGYTLLSVSFLVVFTIPLLTWGVYLVFFKTRR